MTPVIYADTLFLFNFFMDTIILLLTLKTINKKAGILKIATGAALGGVYSVFMFFPKVSILYSWLFKILVLFCISYMVLGGENLKQILKNFMMFIMVNLTMGGALLTLVFLTDFGTAVGSVVSESGVYFNLSPVVLILGLIICYTLMGIYHKNQRRVEYEKNLVRRFKITYKNKACELNGFLDTGCRVSDPVNDRPVIIAEYERIKPILSNEEQEVVEGRKDSDWAYEKGMRILPYTTICGENMIWAIVADKVESEKREWEKVCIGLLFKMRLGEDYGGIVNPRLYLEGNKVEEAVYEN